jgi:Fe-S-cluster-containing dehydrogenase component
MNTATNLMMKCDMCYDRTSVGLKPMCASVCPSQALFFGTREEIEKLRPRSRPVNSFRFGLQTITTRVKMMIPREAPIEQVDVTAAMYQPTIGQDILDDLLLDNIAEVRQ